MILSRKIQKANNVRKVSQNLYILLLKKVNSVKVLLHIICNCFRYHFSQMVLRDPGRNSFFLQKCLIDLIEYPLMQGCLVCSVALISSKVSFSEKKSRISSTYILWIVSVWMNLKNGINSQYLSQSKRSCSDLYSYWLKKIVEINILFGYEFDINAKIRLDN